MGKPHIAIRITPSLLEELNSYVEKIGTSRTDVVITAIAQYIGSAKEMPLSQRMAEVERRLGELEAKVN